MLPDIVAEAIQFLPRTDLDKLWWLGAMIAKTFKVHPLRRVDSMVLANGFDKNEKKLRLTVSPPAPSSVGRTGTGLAFDQRFDNVDDALTFVASLVPHTSFNRFLVSTFKAAETNFLLVDIIRRSHN